VAADRNVHSKENERLAKEMGVKKVCLPKAGNKSAERVREKVAFECLAQGEVSSGGSPTISVGVASLGEDTATLQQLIQAADVELYRAKAAGKNRVAAAGKR
jgi:diguanylate cyclase (GGDEF)-like protein